jgi:hypothetical protein
MTVKETEALTRKPAPVPLCPPQTPHALTECEPGPPRWEPVTNHWSYSTDELVPISGHQHQQKTGYTNQTQHKPSAEVTANFTEVHIQGALHLGPCIIIKWPESTKSEY